jgi:flagellar protein FliS
MNQAAAYRVNSVSTLQPGRVIVVLYEGAIKFLRQAIIELEAGRYMEKGQRINQAVDIIQELKCSLDSEAGGETAANLGRLYDFMIRHLCQANATKDAQKIQEVISLLTDLNQAWKAVTA